MTARTPDPPVWPDAACANDPDADRWFPISTRHEDLDPLRAVCEDCPVRDDCLTWAIDNRQEHGVWGGMTDQQRNQIRRGTTTADREWDRYRSRLEARRRERRQASRQPRLPLPDGDVAVDIIEQVAGMYDVALDELFGRDRTPRVVEARHDAMRKVREHTKLSYPAIGNLFCRDYSTVISAVNGKTRDRRISDDVA